MAKPSTVEAYLAELPEASRATFERLRSVVRSAAPDATETISYRIPALKAHGRMLVWYAAFAGHCSLFPATEGVREVLGEALRPHLAGKGTIRFELGQPLPEDLIRRIVAVRLEENAAAGRR